MTPPKPKPLVDVPLSEALESLTGFEMLAIEKRFGLKGEDLGGTSLLLGVVWAYRSRQEKTAWNVVEAMTLKQLKESFADEPEDEDAAGKSASGEPPT